ncbi:MAG: S-layer homology domain-containing protein [Clostridia bacterium]|nr:S-layer homology domain-containing protein [Clostridia bacterium]
MKNMLKRLFTLLLAVTMVVGTVGTLSVFAANEIVGDSNIYLPPTGKTMRVGYGISGTSEPVVWSLQSAVNGVSMMEDGGLLVSGNATAGATITIEAKAESGTLLAEKTVTIIAKPEQYGDLFDRYYEDFEVYANDSTIAMKATPQRSTLKYYGTNLLVGKETNGNTYAKSSGLCYWGGNAGFVFGESWNTEKQYMYGSKIATVDGRFMIENPSSTEQSLMWFENAGVRLGYKVSSSPEKADVYSHGTKVATVDINEWFDLRIEFDHVSATYDAYLNDVRILDDKTMNYNIYVGSTGGQRGYGFYIGASVDDLAMYNGRLMTPAFPELPEVVYLTDSRNEAVLDLDTTLLFGGYEIENAVTYTGVTQSDGKLILSKGSTANGVAIASAYAAEKQFTITTANGLDYDFSDSLHLPAGTGAISDGKLDITSGYAEFDLMDATGRVLITYDLYNQAGNVGLEIQTDSATKNISYAAADADGKSVIVVLDTIKDTYMVILGDAIMEEGTLTGQSLASIKVSGGMIDNFIFTSMCKTNPFVFNAVINGAAAVGQTVEADYRYVSPWNAERASETVQWWTSATQDGTYTTKVGEGASYTPNDTLVNQWVRFTVSASDGQMTSNLATSDPVQIADVYTVEFDGSNIKTEILNSLNVPHVFAITKFYVGNVLVKTKMNKVTFGSGSSEVLVTAKDGCDGAAVLLLYPETLKPVSAQKTIGTVPTEVASTDTTAATLSAEVKNGKLAISSNADDLASVVIYGHTSGDIFAEYSDVFDKAEVFAKTEDTTSLVFATNIALQANKKAEITLPQLARGAYYAEIVTRGGETLSYLWMEQPQDILKNSEMSQDGFFNVINLFSKKTNAEKQWIFDEYKKMSQTQKEATDKLIAAEGYDMQKLDTIVSLMAYLATPSLTGDAYTKFKAECLAKGYDVTKVELLPLDAEPATTVGVIYAAGWTDLDSFLTTVYEKSMLYGIYHVRNYQEADGFLKKLTNSNYAQSPYQDGICDLVAGTLYNNLNELRTAINNYTPPGGGGGGGGGGGFGGGGGAVGGGRPIAGDGTPAQVISPTPTPVPKNVYSDVDTNHWANEAIAYLKDRNVINGMPDGRFLPEGKITRAEFVKIICEAFMLETKERASFADVKTGDWYTGYVEIAGGLQIVNGSEGMFFPQREITREDAAVILYRVIENAGLELQAEGTPFADAAHISGYAKEGIGALRATGLINGMEDGNFYPKNNMTRAECAKMVSDILRRYGI